ncbi:MAG: FAD-binding domain-containing protein [Betaproteobacteria bacterium]
MMVPSDPAVRPTDARDTALVWLKRDLRLADHAPLSAAQGFSRALAVFIIESAWLASPECDASHVAFALACVEDLRQQGLPVLVRQGEAVEVLQTLRAEHGVTHLLSHEETGPGWTWERDKAVAAWCHAQGVRWTEFAQTGVVRRLRNRNGWAGRWQARMDAPQLRPVTGLACPPGLAVNTLPSLAELGMPPHNKHLQAAGERAGHQTLDSFLRHRGCNYRRSLSSPLTAEESCSRLSPHLAFGTLSMRTVHQATEARIATLGASTQAGERAFAHALRGFAGRLRWHCHFMQKLEDEPAIEWRNFARSADGLRPGDDTPLSTLDQERLAAWCEGRTGFPMVDACMRSLRATGWLNFRMRAMLVSFAAYHLWLHWRAPGLFLARQFLDFEPGIHWSQMQMQSGTTGINTLRIYSPTKQMQDHDPQGTFVRRWVPEWGTEAYPSSLVDERAAAQAAKEKMYGLRKTPDARMEADHIQQRHGSRLSGLPPSGRRASASSAPAHSLQRDLFE